VNLKLDILGAAQLRERLKELGEAGNTGTLVRKGMSDAGRLIARAQKERAPVRQGRVSMRKLKRNIAAGQSLTKARSGATSIVKKFRAIAKVKTENGFERPAGPRQYIPPGLLKRSIGYRVRKVKGVWQIVSGANVGKKRKDKNFAPHRAFVGSGTVQRYSNKFNDKIGPQRVNRGRMPANPYIMAGLNAAAGAALKALEAGVRAFMNVTLKSRLLARRSEAPRGVSA